MMDSPQERWYLLLVCAAGSLILLVNLLLPLGFDNNIYQSMGWALYAYHALPYTGSWDHNFPGIAYIHALSISLFGNSDLGFRTLDTIIHAAMVVLFYHILRHWFSREKALFAALLSALYYVAGQWWLSGQRDGYAVGCLLVATLLYISTRAGKPYPWRTLLMGAAASGMVLMRPTYALFVLSLAALLWELDARGKRVLLFVAGNAIVWLLVILPYMWIPGGLEQVYDSIIRFNLDLYANVDVPKSYFSYGRLPIYVLGLFGLLPVLRTERLALTAQDRRMVLYYLVSGLLSVIAMGKYFNYHLEPVMAILIAATAHGVYKLMPGTDRTRFRYSTALALLLLYAYLYYPRHLVRYYVDGLKTGHPLSYTYHTVLSDSLTGLTAQDEVCSYLERPENLSGPIEYASLFPMLRWRIERPEASRFTTILALTIDGKDGYHPSYQQAWRRDFLKALDVKKPHFVITLSGNTEWWPFIGEYVNKAHHRIPGFDSVLATDYNLDTVIRGFTLYRRTRW